MSVDYKKELQALIELLLEEKSSDIHFSVGAHPLIRVAGTLIPLVKTNLNRSRCSLFC